MVTQQTCNPDAPDATERDFPLGVAPYRFSDLFDTLRLRALYETFCASLGKADAALAADFAAYHADKPMGATAESDLLIRVGAFLGPFVARLFHAEPAAQSLKANTLRSQVIFEFKSTYVGKRLRKKSLDPAALDMTLYNRIAVATEHPGDAADDAELQAARTAMIVLRLYQVLDRRPAAAFEELTGAANELEALVGHPVGDPKATAAHLLTVIDAWHLNNMQQTAWVSYQQPHALDPTHVNLLAVRRPHPSHPETLEADIPQLRPRDGFGLTDKRMDTRHILNELDYCLDCHLRQKDSCRHGLRDKNQQVKPDPKGIMLAGCPLDERISEMHTLREAGDAIAALAMVCVDNPMCPGTGHRICNDCMKSCVFQRQEPVNIPQVETSVLTDVLHMPLGFEIYSLLTRWNPLNRQRPYPLPYNGRQVLVTGLGPAGYTLAHYLVNEGFGVVGIDGLKIEPLPDDLTGADGGIPRAVHAYSTLEDALDERILRGFGGVAEYGITVRWDKNFLKVIYLNLVRRASFRCFGGIRFGGTLTLDDAWELGFHHVAIAAGAGRPTMVQMKNNLLRGMRAASDFLMSLQLSGAFKKSSLANLQVELPAVVIGGGLTAVDTATELAAYYPVQVEKIACMVERAGVDRTLATCDTEEHATLTRFLEHARQLREERKKPDANVPALVQQWGGVHVVYRRALSESPAYRLNHEEVQKALEEGIYFSENLTPLEAVPDSFGHVDALTLRRADGSEVSLPARAVMIAAGTSPNVIYEREQPGTFNLDGRGKFFMPHAMRWENGEPHLQTVDDTEVGFFTSYQREGRRFVSFYGDNHPRYAGNVVRAMASAKHGYREVAKLFADVPPAADLHPWENFISNLEAQWLARVERIERLSPTIIEVVVRAPMQARKFEPGQFYRLQNYEANAKSLEGYTLTMENLALTGAWVDKEQGLLSMIALEMGVSSRLCAELDVGELVVVMGPTGAATDIPEGENVILCGGGLGNAVLFSVAKAMRQRGNRVIYFAGYRAQADIFKREEIEQSTDQIIWSVDQGAPPTLTRPQDLAFTGNIVQAMQAYAEGSIGPGLVPFDQIHRIIAIGSDRMMAAVTRARKTVLSTHLAPHHTAIASINSPMQCMMKEVCAQCLQRHVDPNTGEESFVFSCFNQDQPQDSLDWEHLTARLRQNTLVEKISNLWYEQVNSLPHLSDAPRVAPTAQA